VTTFFLGYLGLALTTVDGVGAFGIDSTITSVGCSIVITATLNKSNRSD